MMLFRPGEAARKARVLVVVFGNDVIRWRSVGSEAGEAVLLFFPELCKVFCDESL